VVELCEGGEVALQPGLEAFAGAQDGCSRRVEACVGRVAAARVVHPLQTLQEQIEPESDLQDRQNVKSGFHVFPA